MEEQKKSEGAFNSDKERMNSEDVEQVQASITVEGPKTESGDTISEIEEESKKTQTIKNLVSLVIILAGVAVGSFFIDVVQFVSGSGYSERALRDSDVFVAGDKTWVSFQDPAVNVSVVTVADEEMESCKNCDPTDVLVWLKRFVPTIVSKKVIASAPEGQDMIKKFGIKSLPAYVFSPEIEDTEFYQGEAGVLFEGKANNYVLNSAGLGIPVGKYLEVPSLHNSDAVMGNIDAPVKIFVYSDFQCPFCSNFYEEVKDVAAEYGEDKVALTYRDLPLDFHPQGMNAAHAARCAQDQGKFWEMADLLYGDQDSWGKTTGTAAFKTMATKIGLDRGKFDVCINEGQFSEVIQKDIAEAGNFGISGTPGSFINDQFISGVVQKEELKRIIDEQLQK